MYSTYRQYECQPKDPERSRLTLETLTRAAGNPFKTRRYNDTGTEEIVRSAGLTRRAFYHHFQVERRTRIEGVREHAIDGETYSKLLRSDQERTRALKYHLT